MVTILPAYSERTINHPLTEKKSAHYTQRGGYAPISKHWMTTTEAVTLISKNCHRAVSTHHVQSLVNKGKISARPFSKGTTLPKRSDVISTRVAIGTGNDHREIRAGTV